MYISDALSRAYLPEMPENLIDEELEVATLEIRTTLSVLQPEKLTQLKSETAKDETLQRLILAIEQRMAGNEKQPELSPYSTFSDELSVIDGLVYRGQRIVIPKTLRRETVTENSRITPRCCEMQTACSRPTESSATVAALKSIFARHGIPEIVFSDNGPQFSSRTFADFATEWGFEHRTSSPKYPQSNGQAERCVQTIKNLMKKAEDSKIDMSLALLDYRASPIEGIGLSPAQLAMNRQLRGTIPMATNILDPSVKPTNQQSSLMQRQMTQKKYYDRQSKVLPELKPGETIQLKTDEGWSPAIVEGVDKTPRSYLVKTPRAIRRNRKFLRKSNVSITPQVSNDSEAYLDTNTPIVSKNPNIDSNTPECQFESDDQCCEPPAPAPQGPTTRTTRSGRVIHTPKHLDGYDLAN
ncbi:uncharacterized protein [Argopecten irradians]|uniref:uncharacterized protein n=1 Tax=Argopecten irradians TaxID=31199 RepID=UPI00371D7852